MKFKHLIFIAIALASNLAGMAQQQETDSLINLMTEIAASDKPGAKAQLREVIKAIAKRGDELNMERASTAAFFMGDPILSDSIYREIARLYPAGGAAKTIDFVQTVGRQAGGKQTENALKKWKTRFPDTSIRSDLYEEGKKKVAQEYALERKYSNAGKWAHQLLDKGEQVELKMQIGHSAFEQGDTAIALSWQQQAIVQLREMKGEAIPPVQIHTRYLQQFANTLYNVKRYADALQYIREAYGDGKNAKADLTKDYAVILAANKMGTEAFPLLEDLVSKGEGNKLVEQWLKTVYIEKTGSGTGYEDYLKSLKKTLIDSIKTKMAATMIEKEAYMFTLKDLDNNYVSLKDLKGKVVVLDFWATWCGPCKKSFPAMKMAMERYQSDKDVRFLFIDCMEKVKDPTEAIRRFLTANHYPFEVLLDNETTGVIEKYEVKGIPTKFVIDRNGKIRFRVVGFEGGDEAAVEELSTLIELTKNAS